ncbi:MAG TPA: VCBS repeat-containing protein, partial [Chthonomonadales bacterium]|nr:VCBS repeat-containing protein [Chthonomonadales bacterium]
MRILSRSLCSVPIACLCVLSAWGCSSKKTPPVRPEVAAQPVDPSAFRFSDVTQAAGINYKWTIAGARPLNILQTIGNGCAFLDYNNDGNLDILLVGPQLALYRGDGKGHFIDVTQSVGLDKLKGHWLGCAVGDYDNDGFDDIYLTAYRGGALLHNEGGKRFRDVTAASGIPPQPWATSAAFVDVNNDGLLDLFICDYVKFGPHTKPQLCPYTGLMSACGPRFYDPEKGRLYINLGGGRFKDASSQWGVTSSSGVQGKDLGVACADFDGSGRQSVAVANDEVAGDLLQNMGGKFSNVGTSSGTAFDTDGNVHGG